MPNGQDTQRYRVEQLEKDRIKDREQVDKVTGKNSERMDAVMITYLPLMQTEITQLKTRINIFGTLIMGAFSTLIALVIGKLL